MDKKTKCNHEWIEKVHDYLFGTYVICDKCGEEEGTNSRPCVHNNTTYKYCPNCGIDLTNLK